MGDIHEKKCQFPCFSL